MAAPPTLCLNMIVKNESKVIRRLLTSVLPFIDSFCICDTGSTDDTVEIIRTFFDEKRVPGRIIQEPFRDFGYNRTYALKACRDMPSHQAEYILLLDADMVLTKNDAFTVEEFKRRLSRFKAFHLFQGTSKYQYKNVRIVKNYLDFSYWGVTHEYVRLPEGVDVQYGAFTPQEVFIEDVGDGGSKADKFDRDIRLLTQGLVDNPNNDRYTFYLANSYRDKGENETAIEYYKKRITLGGWIEEVWFSYYSIGRCYKRMGNMGQAIYYWLEGFHAYNHRIENLHEIVHHYRVEGRNELAYTFYMLADETRKKQPHRDFLFTENDVYEYKLDYELSIVGYYCNKDKHNMSEVCMTVLKHLDVEASIYRNVLSNYKFYAENLSKYALELHPKTLEALLSVGRDVLAPHLGEFVSSTPSICFDAKLGDLVVCVRYVNYRIDDQGNYVNQDKIETKNVVARFNVGQGGTRDAIWRQTMPAYELKHDTKYDGRYVGLEDVRLFSYSKDKGQGGGRGRIIYNANRGLEGVELPKDVPLDPKMKMCVEHGWIVHDAVKKEMNTVKSSLLHYDQQHAELEKNWVLFGGDETGPERNGALKCVYKWSPLIIGTVCPEMGRFTETHRITHVPHFFKDVRCSTCGVTIDDEIWFIGHLVSYEDRRYYYHLVMVLDRYTYAVKKYTPLWTFEKAKVEYTLGMVYFDKYKRFMIGYSVMDRETKYLLISKHIFDDRMIFCDK